jgi:SAM-dependent methyltransferase
VARHRAARLHHLAPPGDFLDLGCGIGGDLLALAQHRPMHAYELDPTRAALAAYNVDNIKNVFSLHPVSLHVADWTAALVAGALPSAGAAFADPARRTAQGKRVFSLHAMQPALAVLLALQAQVTALAVKAAPSVRDAEIPPGCSVEFVSHGGVCKEAVLWFGPLAGDAPRWASVHDGESWHTLESRGAPPPLGAFDAGDWLYEPDPAVLRAGAIAELCAQLDAHLFDAEIGYLLATTQRPTPFARAFRVLERHSFSLKVLNARLAALGVGTVEIKKRGFPMEPETLRPRLRLTPGGPPAVIFLTRRGRDHWMLLAERAPA